MSSLQKFHRRTQSVGPVSPFTTAGSGNSTVGYYLMDWYETKIIIAPKSTEITAWYGSNGIFRNAMSNTDGMANTNILAPFGSSNTSGHPAAYHCKNLTTGGYNTWYLGAKQQMDGLAQYGGINATPFSTSADKIQAGQYYWTSTEVDSVGCWATQMQYSNNRQQWGGKNNSALVRAIRQV